ncbi:MAG: hypothetical protein ABI674_10710 [Spartobacteria bacterium]
MRHPAKRRPLGQACLSALLSGAIFLAALLSSAPAWHESLHSDKSATHVCLVTFSAAGQCELAAVPPGLESPTLPMVFGDQLSAVTFSLPNPQHFSLLEHAPPSFA